MSGFSIGGIGKGLKAGLQYDVQYTRNWLWAAKTKNQEAINACIKIGETNLHEILGTATDVTESHAVSLLFAGDPFQASRQLMHDFEARFGKH